MTLLLSVLLKMCSMSNNANKLVIFSDIAWYYGDK